MTFEIYRSTPEETARRIRGRRWGALAVCAVLACGGGEYDDIGDATEGSSGASEGGEDGLTAGSGEAGEEGGGDSAEGSAGSDGAGDDDGDSGGVDATSGTATGDTADTGDTGDTGAEGDGDGDGDGDGAPPAYGPCNAGACDEGGETCVATRSHGVCALGCSDPAECPVPADGEATVVCVDPLSSGTSACALDCAGGLACPGGMECVDTGTGEFCLWPS